MRGDYSWTDGVLTFWATLVLTVMAGASLVLRYVTDPISCWAPAEFNMNYVKYTNWKCFTDGGIQVEDPESSDMYSHVTYHQWVPFALGVGALLCLLPHTVWRLLSPLLLDAHALLSALADNQRQAADRRHVVLRDTAILLQSALKRGNSWLTLAVLGRKLLACVTCFLQFVLVVVLFQPQLGARSASDVMDYRENATTPLPTDMFFCLFKLRQLQTVQEFQVQCILPLAQVYDKGFAFLFYFFVVLLVLCALDLLLWSARVLLPTFSDQRVKWYLDLAPASQSADDQSGEGAAVAQLFPRFAQGLGWDGRLLLALTADYCGPLAAADLTSHLWQLFKGTPRPAAPTAPYVTPTTVGGGSGRGYVGGDSAAIPLVPVSGNAGVSDEATIKPV